MRMHTHGGGCFSSFEQLKACHEEKLQIPEAKGLGVGPAARATHDLASSLAPLRLAPLPVGRAPGLAHGAWLASDTGGDAGHARPCHSPPGGEGGCVRCSWAPGPRAIASPRRAVPGPVQRPLTRSCARLCRSRCRRPTGPRRGLVRRRPGVGTALRLAGPPLSVAGPEQARASRGPLARAVAAAAVPTRHSANIS